VPDQEGLFGGQALVVEQDSGTLARVVGPQPAAQDEQGLAKGEPAALIGALSGHQLQAAGGGSCLTPPSSGGLVGQSSEALHRFSGFLPGQVVQGLQDWPLQAGLPLGWGLDRIAQSPGPDLDGLHSEDKQAQLDLLAGLQHVLVDGFAVHQRRIGAGAVLKEITPLRLLPLQDGMNPGDRRLREKDPTRSVLIGVQGPSQCHLLGIQGKDLSPVAAIQYPNL